MNSPGPSPRDRLLVDWLVRLQILIVFCYYILGVCEPLGKGLQHVAKAISVLFLLSCLHSLVHRHLRVDGWIFALVTLMMPFMFLSNRLNEGSFEMLFKAYVAYFQFIPTYIVITNCYDVRQAASLFRFMMLLYSFQLPIVLMQIPYYKLVARQFHPDLLKGTFPSSNDLGYSMGFVFVSVFIILINRRFFVSKLCDSLFLFLSLIIIFLVESRGALAGIILTSAVLGMINMNVYLYVLRNLKKLLVVAVICLFTGSLTMGSSILQNSFFYIFDVREVIEAEQTVGGGSSRLLWFPVTYDHLQRFAWSPWIGMGPSAHSSFAAFYLEAPINKRYVVNALNQIQFKVDTGVDSQIIPIWGEYGHLGLILFFGIYVMLFGKHFFGAVVARRDEPGKLRHLLLAGNTLYFVFLAYANQVWQTPPFTVTFFTVIALFRIHGVTDRGVAAQPPAPPNPFENVSSLRSTETR